MVFGAGVVATGDVGSVRIWSVDQVPMVLQLEYRFGDRYHIDFAK